MARCSVRRVDAGIKASTRAALYASEDERRVLVGAVRVHRRTPYGFPSRTASAIRTLAPR